MSEQPILQPAILLHTPQLGENIGSTARAMLNFGLTDLRLIAPRDGWPNPNALPMSAGAFDAGVSVSVFENLEGASAGLTRLYATTARPRGMEKPVLGPSETVADLCNHVGQSGVLFGAENSGLPNDAVAISDVILTYPVNPDFASLNLAQAVLVFAQAWGSRTGQTGRFKGSEGVGDPADRDDLIRMFEHFETELDRAGYFFPPEKTALMTDHLRSALVRANWTTQEVRTFRGAIKALAEGRGKARVSRND
ncbi:MAG: TrmH family RNA methyltransferase [Pseudomonadota bacterium]